MPNSPDEHERLPRRALASPAARPTRRVSMAVAVVLLSAACGSTSQSKPAAVVSSTAAKGSSSTPHDMKHMKTVVPKPIAVTASGYLDATRVDLGGTPGTTQEQQHAAEDFLKRTIETLPRWAEYKTAIADGFVTLDGGIVGVDHMMHWDWLNDGRTFDPTHPESLVYSVDPKTGGRKLEAAMFFLPDGVALDKAPSTFGPLVQYHVHPDLCFERDKTTRLVGVATPPQPCPVGAERLPNPMMHVWIVPNKCGPFAALEGLGGGATASGTHDCDHHHGLDSNAVAQP